MFDDTISEKSMREPLIGLASGALLGIAVVTGYFWQALLVGLFGLVGLAAGMAIMWIRKNPDNLVNAWNTLRNKER